MFHGWIYSGHSGCSRVDDTNSATVQYSYILEAQETSTD